MKSIAEAGFRAMPGRCRPAVALVLAGMLAATVPAGEPPGKVDFSLQVRPILSDRCFACHGPDEKARKGKLRLDLSETARAIRNAKAGEAAIVPSHPERSLLVRRINAADEKERMPPLSSKLMLSPEERGLLKRWIEEGAEYKPHWAFVPPMDSTLPRPADDSRVRNGVDALIAARLEHEGLKFAPEAVPEILIRRLSFDLRGLPPSLAEVDEFLADTSSQAYERLVERFLASPAYGEHQAALWLDLARFADTYGYQADVEVDLSPWRDWVIRAFNDNLPYDQFITWQLAGDLLPHPTREQILATAFNRLHRQTNEGGSIDEEFRAEYVADRVSTTATAFLGLTMACARCHDHKYDPVTQKDFYQMSAFFNNIDESGLYSHFTRATPTPGLLLYPDGKEAQHNALQASVREQEAALGGCARIARDRFEAWAASGSVTVPPPVPVAAYSFDKMEGSSTPDVLSTNVATLVDSPVIVDGKQGRALKFSGDNSAVCKRAGAFNRAVPFSFSLWLRPGEKQDRAVVFHRSRAWSDSGSRGYELVLDQGRPAFGLIHFWPGNAIQVRARDPLPLNTWSHLVITYDGSSHAAGVRLYLNGNLLSAEVVRDHLYKDILHRAEWGDGDVNNVELTLAGRFRDSGFKNGSIDEFQVFNRCLTPGEAKQVAGTATSNSTRDDLFAWYVAEVDPPSTNAATRLHALREEENRLVNDVPEVMVMKEMSPRRPAYLLKRGAYDARGEEVQPGTPDRIFPFPDSLPRNRLGLAQWMIDPQNPLTARVAVNRVWRTHFGRGIVETEEDFGTRGKLPSHPALLDWLARTFVRSGWDVKGLHRLIVLSSTYRQSSVAGQELLGRDPENRLLARGPRHRLRAEEIRDEALSISGLLASRIGGPSARPYQPEGLWEEAGTGKHYVPDKGEGLYRRSLYTFWRRTAPPPTMLIFDAPSREVCSARREVTTTPLQSLVLLNDPQFLEASRVLAEQLVRTHADDPDARITLGFRVAAGRMPDARELSVLRQLYQEQLTAFAAAPEAAANYLHTGDRPPDQTLPAPEVAATTVVANALMNLDEFVTKR